LRFNDVNKGIFEARLVVDAQHLVLISTLSSSWRNKAMLSRILEMIFDLLFGRWITLYSAEEQRKLEEA
jgi:hypothetical protein